MASVGCVGADSASESSWVGTVTTEGGVTTVFNESGSVWNGNATVVEEASIGVDAGPDELMFGDVVWLYEAGGTIYVVDVQVPAVRTFDLDGNFLGTLGAPGQGPGEYIAPWRVVVAPDGRVFVSDRRLRRVNVYASDGTPLDTWTAQHMTQLLSTSLELDEEGMLWIPLALNSPGELRMGMQALPGGEPGERALITRFDGEPVPPTPAQSAMWTTAGGGTMIVGRPETHGYRFEVQRLGETVLAVERFWEPVPVDPDYAAWYLAVYGDERPTHWPPFLVFTAVASGEIWVTRFGPVQRLAGCEQDLSDIESARATSCWRQNFIVDVFGEDGRYLGEIELPDDVTPVPQWMHVDGDMLIARSQQDDGVIRVKRFRIVLPDA